MVDSQFAWLAGLLEGEGSFHIAKSGRYRRPKIALQMTDEDVVRKAHAVARLGNVHGPYVGTDHRKPKWVWSVGSQAECITLGRKLLPLMGERRRVQIETMIGWCVGDRV